MAETKRSKIKLKESQDEAKKYQGIAQQAAESGNEADARQALEMKNSAEKRVDTLKSEIKAGEKLLETLRADLNKARARVSDAESSVTRLEARMEGAKIRTELAKASSTFNSGDSPLAALDDLEQSVEKQETEAEALEDIVGDENAGGALEEKYSDSGSKVDDELKELMAGKK